MTEGELFETQDKINAQLKRAIGYLRKIHEEQVFKVMPYYANNGEKENWESGKDFLSMVQECIYILEKFAD